MDVDRRGAILAFVGFVMEFQGWTSLVVQMRSSKWNTVEGMRITPIEGLKTPKQILVWVRENITYVRDAKDHWQSPEETLKLKTGDCEDFCILMRALLIAAGFKSSDIWMMVGKDLLVREDHAVLVLENKFVLDQRSDKVQFLSNYKNFKPILAYCDDKTITYGRKL